MVPTRLTKSQAVEVSPHPASPTAPNKAANPSVPPHTQSFSPCSRALGRREKSQARSQGKWHQEPQPRPTTTPNALQLPASPSHAAPPGASQPPGRLPSHPQPPGQVCRGSQGLWGDSRPAGAPRLRCQEAAGACPAGSAGSGGAAGGAARPFPAAAVPGAGNAPPAAARPHLRRGCAAFWVGAGIFYLFIYFIRFSPPLPLPGHGHQTGSPWSRIERSGGSWMGRKRMIKKKNTTEKGAG